MPVSDNLAVTIKDGQVWVAPGCAHVSGYFYALTKWLHLALVKTGYVVLRTDKEKGEVRIRHSVTLLEKDDIDIDTVLALVTVKDDGLRIDRLRPPHIAYFDSTEFMADMIEAGKIDAFSVESSIPWLTVNRPMGASQR